MPFSEHAFDLLKRSRCFFHRCPYCHHNHIKKYGKEHGHHRWMPRDCGKMFSDRTGKVLSSTKLRPSQIRRLVSMLSDGATLRQAAHQRHMYHSRPPFCGSGRCRESRKTPETRCFPERSGWTAHTLTRRCQYGKARKGGTGRERRFGGCFSRTYSLRLLRLSRHGALRQLLPRVLGEDGELGGPGCPLSPQSGQPAVCPGQAHVCRSPADPLQERSLMAERESVPEGKEGEHGVRQIPVVLLQKNLLVRENPQKTGCFHPLATLLFILLI